MADVSPRDGQLVYLYPPLLKECGKYDFLPSTTLVLCYIVLLIVLQPHQPVNTSRRLDDGSLCHHTRHLILTPNSRQPSCNPPPPPTTAIIQER